MYKKPLFILVMLIVIAASFFLFTGFQSQQPNTLQATNFTATGSATAINQKGTPVGWHQIVWRKSGTVTTCIVGADSSVDGVTWNSLDVIAGQTCTSNGSFTVATAAYYNYIRVHVTVLTGGGNVTVVYLGWTNDPTSAGASFPLTSPTANPAASGQLRLANNTDKICWRNAANSADECVYFDSSDIFQVEGAIASAPSGGVGGTVTLPEGTAATGSAGKAVCYADSTAHTMKCSYNNGSFTTVPITAAQVVALFSGCSGTQYLGADGACHSVSGASQIFRFIQTASSSPAQNTSYYLGINNGLAAGLSSVTATNFNLLKQKVHSTCTLSGYFWARITYGNAPSNEATHAFYITRCTLANQPACSSTDDITLATSQAVTGTSPLMISVAQSSGALTAGDEIVLKWTTATTWGTPATTQTGSYAAYCQ